MSARPTPRQFEDCLVVGAVGDGLGAVVEFSSWADIQRSYGPDGLREMPARAEFTDDTQMTLFTAEGLIRTSVRLRGKGITTHIDVVRFAYLRWLRTQGYELRQVLPGARRRCSSRFDTSHPSGPTVSTS